jgi:hypothetical protein
LLSVVILDIIYFDENFRLKEIELEGTSTSEYEYNLKRK